MMERIKTGVEGLDELISGVLIKGEVILLAGSIGSGKTIFSTQFIYNGATQVIFEKGGLEIIKLPEALMKA